MRSLKIITAILLISVLPSACSVLNPRVVNNSFYYWKSEFYLTHKELMALHSLKINRIYLKFFDVTWGGAPVPIAQVRFKSQQPEFVNLVPTVFITNETLANLLDTKVPDLGDKILDKIQQMIITNHLRRIPEIQLDSDWTLQTRDKYFALLSHIRSRLAVRNIRLSATIRLHQIKYRSLTGVPPVDRGMLMFYNLSPVNKDGTENSILDLDIGKQYTESLNSYPLPLDVALPIFSWGVVFQDHRFICLANGFTISEVTHHHSFEALQSQPRHFRVKNEIYMHQTRLYPDDIIRIEESDVAVLQETAAYIGGKLPRQPLTVALFHFDQANIRRIGNARLAGIFDGFR